MKILLCSAFPPSNLGDVALLKGMIQFLRETDNNAAVTVMCETPREVAERFTVRAVKHPLNTRWYQSLKAIGSSDIVIIGPGGIIEEATGIGIFKGNIPNLFVTAIVARLLHKKIILYAVGVGPVTSSYGKILVRTMFRLADLITVRDRGSRDYLAALGVDGNTISEVSDPAVLLDPPVLPGTESRKCAGGELPEGGEQGKPGTGGTGKMKIGISIRPWLNGGAEKNTAIIGELGQLCDFLAAEYTAEIVFLPFDYGRDYPLIEAVRRQMRFPGAARCAAAREIEDMLPVIAGLDMVIGMRLHSLVFSAAVMGKPVVALSYDKKIEYFMDSIGQLARVLPIETFSLPRAREVIKDVVTHYHERAAEIAEKSRELRRKAIRGRELLRDRLCGSV